MATLRKHPVVWSLVLGGVFGFFILSPITMLLFDAIHMIGPKHTPSQQFSLIDSLLEPFSLGHSLWSGIISILCMAYSYIMFLFYHRAQKLEEYFDKTKEVELKKDKAITLLSHELKVPTTSILGYAESILELELEKEKQHELLGIIIHESERIGSLVDDILDLAKLNQFAFHLELEKLEITSIIGQAIKVMQGYLIKQNLAEDRILFHQLESFTFLGDAKRLCQVFLNLLTNAIKYSKGNGKVEIYVRRKANCFIVSIKNQGGRIPKEKIQKIFDKYYQLDQRNFGLGVGLAISKKIIDAHHGRIWAENHSQGVLMRFSLPYRFEMA